VQSLQSSRVKVGGAAVVFLAVAGALYVPVVRVQKVDRSLMAQLVTPVPPAGFARRPAAANPVAPSSSDFPAVKSAGKRSPDATGGYSLEWSETGTNDAASMNISLLPSASDAAKTQQEAKKQYTSSGSLKAESYSYAGSFAVPSVPNASAGFYAPSTLTNPPLAVVAFQTGRAQVTQFLGVPGAKQAIEAEAASFAKSEYAHLNKSLGGFSLVRTEWPLVSSIIYWAVALLLLAGAISVQPLRRRSQRRRRLAEERARVQHKTVRGSKIARRQASRRR
jgi:hypothetical protein